MRRRRVDVEGAIHHVMNRGVNRQQVFFGVADRIEFGDRLAEIHERYGVETLAYCLMGNHYHLLLHTPSARLSDAMQHLGGVYTRRTNRRVGRDGPLFRGRFHAIHVTTDSYLTAAARYIHRNPLELPGVRDPASYRWSSYRTYLGLRPPPAFLDTTRILAVHDDDVRQLVGRTTAPGDDLSAARWTLDDIEQLVAFEVARDDVLHGEDDDMPRVLDRTLLVLLTTSGIDPALAWGIEERLRFPSADARRMAVTRARRRLAGDAQLQRILRRLTRHLTHRRSAA